MARPLRVDAVGKAFRVTKDHVRRRGARLNPARLAAVCVCRSLTRRSTRELGTYFGGVSAQAICNLARQAVHQRPRDKTLAARLSAIEAALA